MGICLARALVISVLLLAWSTPAGAEGGRRPDVTGSTPSASKVRAPAAPAAEAPVTVQAVDEPVVSLLTQLSARPGPTLTAVPELGERRVHVLVRDLPEPRLRAELARLIHGTWARRQSGAALHLEEDPAAVREHAAILEARKKRFFDGLRMLTRMLSLDRATVERRVKAGEIALGALYRPDGRSAIQLTALLGEAEWQQLQTTGHLSLPVERLGATGPSIVRDYVQQLNKTREEGLKLQPPDFPAPPPFDPEQALQRPVEFRVMAAPDGPPFSYLMVGWMGIDGGGGATITGSPDFGIHGARWEEAPSRAGEKTVAGPHVTLRFKTKPAGWGEALRQLSEDAHVSILSEEYTRPRPFGMFLPETISGSLPEVLDQLCSTFGYQWQHRDGLYLFRSRTWYLDRPQEPPGTLVKAASHAREKKEPLDLEWLARGAQVSPAQWDRLSVHAPAAEPIVQRWEPLLRWYAALSREEREGLTAPEGLSGTRLALPGREALYTVLKQLAPAWPPSKAEAANIRLDRQHTSARFLFRSDSDTTEAVIDYPSADAAQPDFPRRGRPFPGGLPVPSGSPFPGGPPP